MLVYRSIVLFSAAAGMAPPSAVPFLDRLPGWLAQFAADTDADGLADRQEPNQWDTIQTDIIGQGAVVTRCYSTENQPTRFFRVRMN